MKRLAVGVCALLATLAALVVPSAVVAAGSSGQASGTVVGVSRHTFGLEAAGGRMSVLSALAAAADGVTAGDFPYV